MPTSKGTHNDSIFPSSPWIRWGLIALLAVILSGCTRAYYRRQADKEVYGLIGCATKDPRWDLKDYSITPSPKSRMFDPNNPDRPPMPPDDPTSHELMHCVDGKRGWAHWDRNGNTPFVENPAWANCLPRNDEGAVVFDRLTAVQVALLNSREYQRELENLYLSALDVTFQRFRFDAQFFGVNSTFFTADGPDRDGAGGESSSLLEEGNSLQMQKLTATGGELVVGLANSLVWQFAGPDEYAATTLLDFSMVQPLLRAGGRAVVLENLTNAERALLANVRQMERFRQGFYTQIVAGQNPGAGPSRGGLGLEALQPPLASGTGGILALMEARVRIRNQRSNVAGLRDSLDQLEAFYDFGRIDIFQVDQARQALYNAQTQLASLKQQYQDGLDSYKITLGLPPELETSVNDQLLRAFDLIDPKTTATQESVAEFLATLRDPDSVITPAQYVATLGSLPGNCRGVLEITEHDLRALDAAVPARREFLRFLSAREEITNGDVDPSATNLAGFNRRLATIRDDFSKQQARLKATLGELERFVRNSEGPEAVAEGMEQVGDGQHEMEDTERPAAPLPPGVNPDEGSIVDDLDDSKKGPPASGNHPETNRREDLLVLLDQLSGELLNLSLTQARCRVETITLVPVELDSREALQIARQNRLDWMNARAALVDAWRQIEVIANDLQSDLDVTFSGDMSTLGNNPVRFRGTTGRLRVGLQFDAPLTRLVERNLYREALINYQQARRQYYAYEDRVSQGLRNILRTLERYQLNFELRRAAVHAAIRQVDVTQLRLQQPPKPGASDVFGATTARDLVGALSGLLNSQNEFVSAWVDYEVRRLDLDFDLGTMRLDAQGEWVDPGPIRPNRPEQPERLIFDDGLFEEIPLPDPVTK